MIWEGTTIYPDRNRTKVEAVDGSVGTTGNGYFLFDALDVDILKGLESCHGDRATAKKSRTTLLVKSISVALLLANRISIQKVEECRILVISGTRLFDP